MGILPEFGATVESVPFSDLYVHPLNPRAEFHDAEIETLARNIRDLGLIQNLAGIRDNAGRVGVVAGGRRLRALAHLQDDPRFAVIPVKIAPNEEMAAVWAAAENSVRVDLHPADEIQEYAAFRNRGINEAAIAIAFGVTKEHVKRRLRLADLPEPVLTALRADKIGLSEAKAFVVSNDTARVVEVLGRVIQNPHGYSADHIKRQLKTGAVRDTDRRAIFVGLPAYTKAGGRISSDLFGGEVYLDDEAILDEAFAARLAEIAEDARVRDGWKWARTSPDTSPWQISNNLAAEIVYPVEGELSEADAIQFHELTARAESGEETPEDTAELARLTAILDGGYTAEQRAFSGMVFYVTYNGEIRTTHAMVLPEDQNVAAEAGIIEFAQEREDTDAPATDAGPKLSEALKQDLRSIVRGARQHASLRHPDLLLELLAFHLHSNLGRAFALHRNTVITTPSTETGYVPDPRLLDPSPARGNATDAERAFKAFRKKGAEHIRDVLTLQLARILDLPDSSDGLANLFDKTAKVAPREIWTPTAENFFKRAPSSYLDALWCDMIGIEQDSAEARTFAKTKKSEKVARLETMFQADTELPAQQRARVTAWLPPEMF